mgnify:CR=1 FL=1
MRHIDDRFAGIAVRIWRKTLIGKSKEIGIITIKFNMYQNGVNEILDQWLPLTSRTKKRMKSGEAGEIYLTAKYLRKKSGLAESLNGTSTSFRSSFEDQPLDVSSKWALKDQELQRSNFIVIEEDTFSEDE